MFLTTMSTTQRNTRMGRSVGGVVRKPTIVKRPSLTPPPPPPSSSEEDSWDDEINFQETPFHDETLIDSEEENESEEEEEYYHWN